MNHRNHRLVLPATAAILIVAALALASTLVGSDLADAAQASDAHASWLSTAFPTGQASFARPSPSGI